MKNKNMTALTEKLLALIKKNKFVLLVLAVGLVLLLLPTGQSNAKTDTGGAKTTNDFSLAAQEERIASALSKIDGAGRVTVVLTLKSSSEQVLAQDEDTSSKSGVGNDAETTTEKSTKTVIISTGTSSESPVTLKVIYPEYQGALIVCQGADNAAVKYQIVSAVSGLTGLGADKIVVTKMNKS
ncbi:stage III sporulation protein AG [Oscillospiraceae bacterium CM]|nr:stage III sporulation protein AG [Oscillospiraceae bacterium CM]